MVIVWFGLVMALSIGSCYMMAQAFVYPEFGVLIFGGAILVSTLAFALASKWNRF